MSFARMNRETLLKVADFFDINVDAQDGPKEIRLKLDESGKTYEMWKRFNDPEENNVPEGIAFKQSNLLIKMVRQNPTFEVFGYKFTRNSPYRAVPSDDAQKIMDMYDGFVIATPSEVKSFYDK